MSSRARRGRGERESIGLADAVATSYELLFVAAVAVLVLHAAAPRRVLRQLAGRTGTRVTAAAVVALTALTLALLP